MSEQHMQSAPATNGAETASQRPRVGAVVIGKNEGERLGRAVRAAVAQCAAVIYVDSNSSDGSRELAASLGAHVLHLTSGPYTPSRGRQTGFEELRRLHPDIEYVQFIDGDCVLQEGWVERAWMYLRAHPEVGAVFGRRREERMRESIYSRLMDIDWEHPPGVVANFGGDSLALTGAVERAGGWSPTTINAEDIDLSFRVREQGFSIVRLEDEMTLHDAKMTRFGEYWRRGVRAGYGYAEVGLRYRHGPGELLLKRAGSSLLYAVVLPATALAGVVFFRPLVLVPAALYARVLVKTTLSARARGASLSTAVAYAGLNLVCKGAAVVGMAHYARDRLSGRSRPRDDLIVYRKAT